MCGIIGYVGDRDAARCLLRGLERLEYRGYDSAGICLLTPRGLELIKSVGKLENLKGKANGGVAGHTTGIGHTRWATHGRVSEENAHPLLAGDHDDVAIVLNGIIENHGEIRRRFVAEGETFASQTDAEVVAHLVRRAYRGSLAEAVRTAARELDGHFAFVALHRDQPGLLIGTRRRCPLLVGVGEGEMFLASSMSAFLGETRRVMFVEDDEIVAVTADGARLTTAAGDECDREVIEIPWDDACAERHGHETYMLKEIHEQPEAVNATIAGNLRRTCSATGRCSSSAPLATAIWRASGGSSSSPAGPPTTPASSGAGRSRSGRTSRARSTSPASGATATRVSTSTRS